MSSNNPTPVLAADKLYEAYDRFVCKECAGMTAEYTGVTIGGYRLTVITTADVVEWAGYDQGPLTCECRRLEAVLDEQQQLQIRPGTPLPRPAAVEHRAAIQAVDGVEHLRAVRSWQPGPGVAGQRGAGPMTTVLTVAQVAEHLGLSVRTVEAYRRDGRLPEATMVGRTPTWTRAQIDAWQATRPGQGARTDLRR